MRRLYTLDDACRVLHLKYETVKECFKDLGNKFDEENLSSKDSFAINLLGKFVKEQKEGLSEDDLDSYFEIWKDRLIRNIKESSNLSEDDKAYYDKAIESQDPETENWIQHLKELNENLRGQFESANRRMEAVKKEEDRVAGERQNLEKEKKEFETKANALKIQLQEVEDKRRENSDKEKQLEEKERTYREKLDEEYRQNEQELRSDYDTKNNSLSEERKKLATEREEYKRKIDEKYEQDKAQLVDREKKISESEERLERRQAELKPIYEYLTGLGITFDVNEIESVQSQYVELMSRLGGALNVATQGANKASEDYINTLMESLRTYHEKIDLLREQIVNIVDAKTKLLQQENELEEAKAEYEANRLRLKKKMEEADARAERKKGEEYHSRICELETSVEREKTNAYTAKEQLKQAKAKLQHIYQAFGELSPENYASEYLRIKHELDSCIKEKSQMVSRSEFERLESEKQRIAEELKSEKEAFDIVSKQLSEAHSSVYKEIVENADSNKLKNNQLESKLKDCIASRDTYKELYLALKGESDKNKDAFPFVNENINIKSTIRPFGEPVDLKEFVRYIQGRMAYQGFKYSENTIRVFIAGLHMSSLTILQGLSGMGKTSLPEEFIKAMYSSVTDENDLPLRICPIQSGWRDNMDLLGFYNSFEHKYKETEFFKALFLAGQPKFKDTLFFIVLDEMNLSHPEHYFADFLSAIEIMEKKKHGTNQTVEINAPADVRNEYLKDGLIIPPNVRFIGTANEDETTNSFAPKTIDRSNVMNFTEDENIPNINKISTERCISLEWLNSQLNQDRLQELYKNELEEFKFFIQEIKDVFAKNKLGIGYRFVERQAPKFICAYLACGGSKEDAVDYLMTNRFLCSFGKRYGLNEESVKKFKEGYLNAYEPLYGQGKSNLASKFFLELEERIKDGNI